jgi:predicted nucleic acid-binding Zn finger protein
MSLKKLEKIHFLININKKAEAKIKKIYLDKGGKFIVSLLFSIFLFFVIFKSSQYIFNDLIIFSLYVFDFILGAISLFFINIQMSKEDKYYSKIETLKKEYKAILNNDKDNLFNELKRNGAEQYNEDIVYDVLDIKRNELYNHALNESLSILFEETIELDNIMNESSETITNN